MKELLKYRQLILYLVERDVKKKYRRSVLGVMWSMLNPLLMMLITAMVFAELFRFDLPNFTLYLFVGQMMLNFFAEATSNAMNSVLNNGALIKKVYVPKYLFPITTVLSSGVNLLLSMPAMLLIMCYTGQYPGIRTVSFLLPLVALVIFCIGVGLILSTAAVFFRDIVHLYSVVITALTYATPIIYPEKIVPDKYRFILECNPLYYFVSEFRQVLYVGKMPSAEGLLLCFAISFFSILIGMYVFKKNYNKFILYI